MANIEVDGNFREAIDKIKTYLSEMYLDANFYGYPRKASGQLISPMDGEQKLAANGVQLTKPTPELGINKHDYWNSRKPLPQEISTDGLLTAIQELIAENSVNNAGVHRGEFEAISKQTQFLLDLQRYIARKLPYRLQRLIRAGHRRSALASDRGPLSQLMRKVENEIAAPRG